MRIFGGPRLVVPRKGIAYRHGGWYYRRSNFGHGARCYDEYLALERARVRALPSVAVGDRKRMTRPAHGLKAGASFRRVDGHGRSYGPRWTLLGWPAPPWARVRLVNRQPEDWHSLASRILKRAHRDAMVQ